MRKIIQIMMVGLMFLSIMPMNIMEVNAVEEKPTTFAAKGDQDKEFANGASLAVSHSITADATYTFKGDANIKPSNGAGIKVAAGITLRIVIENNGVVNITAGGIGFAGIELPATSTLIVKGTGTLNVTGADGMAATNGADGGAADTWQVSGGDGIQKHIRAGGGGVGGIGGSAPGAGIGGSGGLGGAAGTRTSEPAAYWFYQWEKERKEAGTTGTPGQNGTAGGSCGDVYVVGAITLNAKAGALKLNTAKRQADIADPIFHLHTDTNRWASAASGAGGGAGGDAKGTPGIGGAGSGGGGGGAGGNGAYYVRGEGNQNVYGGADGGSAGAGSSASDAKGGKNTPHYNPGLDGIYFYPPVVYPQDGNEGGVISGGAAQVHSNDNGWSRIGGGMGSKGGDSPISGLGGNIYSASIATVNIDTGSTTVGSSGGKSKIINGKMIFLEDTTVSISDDHLIYDTNEQKPTITFTDKYTKTEYKGLKEGEHYNATYTNNKNAGTATLKISSVSNQNAIENAVIDDGKPYTTTFNIAKATDEFELNNGGSNSYTYGASFIPRADSIMDYNNGDIKWEVVNDATHAAKAIITLASGNKTATIIPTSTGLLKIKVTIEPKENGAGGYNFVETSQEVVVDVSQKDIADVTMPLTFPKIDSRTYTGAIIKPDFGADGLDKITFLDNKDTNKTDLLKDTDYALTYGDETANLNANVQPLASVTITGKGNYTGIKTMNFKIDPRDITSDNTVTVDAANPTFTGFPLKPIPTVKIGGVVLPTTDYNNEYTAAKEDFINVGTKSVKVIGTKNLTGSKSHEYTIDKANIQDSHLVKAPDVFFTGEKNESRPELTFTNIPLSEGTVATVGETDPEDYTLTFTNDKEVGTASIMVDGINNFEGSKTITYQIKKRPLYVLPDAKQGKYYGEDDMYGEDKKSLHPTYKSYMFELKDKNTAESTTKIESTGQGDVVKVNDEYPVSLANNLSRENKDTIAGNQLGDYKFTLGNLLLDNKAASNYELKIDDKTNLYNISMLDLPNVSASLEGTLGKRDWYVKDRAKIVAPKDYTVSNNLSLETNNAWDSNITFGDGDYSIGGNTYYLRQTDGNAILKGKVIKYKQDTINPKGNINVGEDAWNLLGNNIDYSMFLNHDVEGAIFAEDATSLVARKSYYLSDKELTIDDLDALKGGSTATNLADPQPVNALDINRVKLVKEVEDKTWIDEEEFKIEITKYNEKKLIVYARVEDYAGNVTYVSSEGMVFDKDAPTLSAQYLQDGKWTTDANVNITGNVYDLNSGIKDRYAAYRAGNDALQILKVKDDDSFEITNLKDGDYQLVISAWDKALNEAIPVEFNVKKDTVVPNVLLSANTTDVAFKQEVTFDFLVGASDVSKLEVSFNGGEWTETSHTEPFFAEANGTYKFRITNGAGVVSDESSIKFTRIDRSTPKVEIHAKDEQKNEVVEGAFVNKDVNAMFVNTEKSVGTATYKYKINDGTYVDVFGNLDNEAYIPKFTIDGVYKIEVSITAENGQTGTAVMNFTIDKIVPSGTIEIKDVETSLFNIFSKNKQDVIITPTDGGSGIKSTSYYIVSGKKAEKPNELPTDAKDIEALVKNNWVDGKQCRVEKDDQYVVYFKMVDKAGNIAYVRSDRIVIDNAAPVITVDYDRDSEWLSNPVIKVKVEDKSPGVKAGSVKYTIGNGTEQTGNEAFQFQVTDDGEQLIKIEALDGADNRGEVAFTIKMDNKVPTITAAAESAGGDGKQRIKVLAAHDGPSKLKSILLSKNGKEFEDITSKINNNIYMADENGLHIFKAVSGSGAEATAEVTITGFVATQVTAKVSARKADGTGYTSDSWSNQDVKLSFSNIIANLDGLTHSLKIGNGSWTNPTTTDGYVNVEADSSQDYSYKLAIANNPGSETTPIDFKVKIDKTKPTVKIKIENKEYSALEEWINGITLGAFFKEAKSVTITGEDTGAASEKSGIETTQYFTELVENIPDSLTGNGVVASDIEKFVNGRWENGNATTLSPNNSYVVFAKTSDYAGNTAYASSKGLVFDNITPSLDSDIDQTNWYVDNTTNIQFTAADNLSMVESASYMINDGTPTVATLNAAGEFVMPTSAFDEGENTISVVVTDKSKNVDTFVFRAKKDSKAPTIAVSDITVADPDDVVRERNIKVEPTVGASGVEEVQVREPGTGSWKDITSTYQSGYKAKENGVYWFRTKNKAGVVSVAENIELGQISSDVPILDVIATYKNGTTYIPNTWANEEISVQFSNIVVGQVVEGYYYKVDEDAYQKIDGSSRAFKSIEGTHTYTMKVKLDNGLESKEESIVIKMDATTPTIKVNSDLTKWVKENTLVEVEIEDDTSGVKEEGYSFDGGNSWQSDKKAMVYANKIMNVQGQDNANNIGKENVEVAKIDSQGPSVSNIKQIGSEESKTRSIEATIKDVKDILGNEGSGVKNVYITTSYPYLNGELNLNPSTTFKMKENGAKWQSEQPISVPYNGTNPIWIAGEDEVGNIKIYSTVVSNMIGSGDGDGNVVKPEPGKPSKPGSGSGNTNTNTNTNIIDDGSVSYLLTENGIVKTEGGKNNTISNSAKNEAEMREKYADIESYLASDNRNNGLFGFITLTRTLWVLALALFALFVWRYKKYRDSKKEYEETLRKGGTSC